MSCAWNSTVEDTCVAEPCRCLRWAETEAQHQASMVFYGYTCADDADLSDLEAFLSSGMSPEQQQQVLETVQLQSMQQAQAPWQRAALPDRRPPKPPPRQAAHFSFTHHRLTDVRICSNASIYAIAAMLTVKNLVSQGCSGLEQATKESARCFWPAHGSARAR